MAYINDYLTIKKILDHLGPSFPEKQRLPPEVRYVPLDEEGRELGTVAELGRQDLAGRSTRDLPGRVAHRRVEEECCVQYFMLPYSHEGQPLADFLSHRWVQRLLLDQMAELSMVLYLLVFWFQTEWVLGIDPQAARFVQHLPMFEFIASHGMGILCGMGILFSGKAGRIFLLVIGLCYGAFFMILAGMGFWSASLSYGWTLASRVARAVSEGKERELVALSATNVIRVFFMLACVVVGLFPWWPNLGLSDATIEYDIFLTNGPGRWMACLVVYFALVPKLERRIFAFIRERVH